MSEQLVELLKNSERMHVFTGAGVSTGSGIRDFRRPQGVWKNRQPVYFQDFLSSEEARVEYRDQKLEAWPSFREARPNAVHSAIADLEGAGKLCMVLSWKNTGFSMDNSVSVYPSDELAIAVSPRMVFYFFHG